MRIAARGLLDAPQLHGYHITFKIAGNRYARDYNKMIEEEVGADVYAPNKSNSKLKLLENWLYGTTSKIEPRLAPSIIARSEAELLGISSPRFAIRVYIGKASFVNIRRRKITARQIRKTYDEKIADFLQGIVRFSNESEIETREKEFEATKRVNWIADCLLEPPARLVDEGFTILTCDLGPDCGEDHVTNATPFVTHISIGGGLCAQASCYMALCLSETSHVYGISEITLLASHDQSDFEIHGLNAWSMKRFFKEKMKLGSDLQCAAEITEEDEVELEIAKIRLALHTCIENRIPVLIMLSASRMQGFRPLDETPSLKNPIIASSNRELIPGDSRLPLGGKLDYTDLRIATNEDIERDHHCVVLIGCNKDASCFLINDPATFPFVKCTAEQLFEARNYENLRGAGSSTNRTVLGEITEANLAQFQFLPVAPAGVNFWLLNLVGDMNPQRIGLIQLVPNSMTKDRYNIPYPANAAKPEKLKIHLGRKIGDTMFFRSGYQMDDNLSQLFKTLKLENGVWYWVSESSEYDISGTYQKSLFFWNASMGFASFQQSQDSQLSDKILQCVVGMKSGGEWDLVYPGVDANENS